MPYVPPSVVLRRLSEFTADTVVGAIGEESTFVRAQVGSMSSTLGFLAHEVERRDEAVLEQRRATLEALKTLESLEGDAVEAFVVDQRKAIESTDPALGNTEAVRSSLREVLEAIRAAVEDDRFDDTAAARAVLYDLFETRVDSQLRMLGREG